MVLNLKFKATPNGTDAVYVFVPGLIDAYYIRPDWQDANYIVSAAITYLGRRGQELRNSTGGRERVVVSCTLLDFIFEPFPSITIEELGDPEPGQKIIQLDQLRGKASRRRLTN